MLDLYLRASKAGSVAHFEGEILHLLYPPDPRTETATMREGQRCAREGITINIFLLQSWNQSHEDIQFAYRLPT